MHDELVKRLRCVAQLADKRLVIPPSVCIEAADAIEELSAKVSNLQIFADNISKLPEGEKNGA